MLIFLFIILFKIFIFSVFIQLTLASFSIYKLVTFLYFLLQLGGDFEEVFVSTKTFPTHRATLGFLITR